MAPLMLYRSIMLIAGIILAGFAVTGVVFGFVITKTAPVGYQDEQGFHYGAHESVATETLAFEVPHAKAA